MSSKLFIIIILIVSVGFNVETFAGKSKMPREAPLRNIKTRKILRLEDFGAKPNDSINDLSAIRKAFAAAARSAVPTELLFQKGRYYLKNEKQLAYCLVLQNATNVVINGNGAEIIVQNPLT